MLGVAFLISLVLGIVSLTSSYDQEVLQGLKERERQLDESVWSNEVQANRYAARIVALWDALLANEHDLSVIANMELNQLSITSATHEKESGWNTWEQEWQGPATILNRAEFRARVSKLKHEGYDLEQSEWHHLEFTTDGRAPASIYEVVLHAKNTRLGRRYIVNAEVRISSLSRSLKQ